ncbi:MAG: enoyl-CoA hydratase/isomerase family protein [Betaproteobacteria bacterium]|jgi:methylglutaconyl-CoA hydratase|nr:enoyl-CoA hydratase/isomerase family protein [Betaproteobacteria bacterium]MCC7217342.1 enoyl-CoA hydratase/isomerase family protein [Burkholderiales bacterium]
MARKKAAPAPAGYTTIDVAIRNGIGIVSLDRPDVHNAFDDTLIAELTEALGALARDDTARVVVLAGNGPTFCAGADLNWMKKAAGYSRAQNTADAKALALMLRTLAELPKPTVARVHGAAYGGGVGLTACCDIAVAAVEAKFALSEAKLGIIPATISPYVIRAIGARQASRFFLTAERFDAAEAFRIGLVHDIVPIAQLDDRVNELLGPLLVAGPNAQRECKALIRAVADRPVDAKVVADTVRRIAAVRSTPEAKEGMAAFLGKRAAAWVPAALADAK